MVMDVFTTYLPNYPNMLVGFFLEFFIKHVHGGKNWL